MDTRHHPTAHHDAPRASLHWLIVDDAATLARVAAERVIETIDEVLARGDDPVLVLPTGRTPEPTYRELVRRSSPSHWRQARTFNLDEYVGVPRSHPGSYAAYMREHLFKHVDIDPGRCHLPDGMAGAGAMHEGARNAALSHAAVAYEQLLMRHGPADIALLGLGHNGHIAFNEPGSPLNSRTRVVRLDARTRRANREVFPDGEVPELAVTMGIATILSARRIVVLVSGDSKAEALKELASGTISRDFPASALHLHEDVTVIADREAARLLHGFGG